MMSIMPYCLNKVIIIHTASLGDLNIITARILPSIQDVREFHALSPPSAWFCLDSSPVPLFSHAGRRATLRAGKKKEGPGTHCMCMHQKVLEF